MHNLSSFVQITGENIVVKVLALCLDVVRPQYMVTSIHGNSYYNFPKDVYFSKKSLERLRVFAGFFFLYAFPLSGLPLLSVTSSEYSEWKI